MGTKITPCGIFFDENFDYMTASPDGFIGTDGIVVISCPLAAENVTVEEGVLKGWIKFWSTTRKPRKSKALEQTKSKTTKTRKVKSIPPEDVEAKTKSNNNDSPFVQEIISLNKKSQLFYHIQGALHITQRKYAIFVAWTSKNIKTESIERDDAFWTAEIQPEIVNFFENRFLPKIIRANR